MRTGYLVGSSAALCISIWARLAHAEEPVTADKSQLREPVTADKSQLEEPVTTGKSPFTAGKSQLGGSFDFGFTTGNDDIAAANPYGLGFGADLGRTLGKGMYVGLEFNYFFGTTQQESGVDSNTNVVQYGVEFGYDAGVSSDVVMRPKLGFGVATVSTEEDGGDYVGGASKTGLFMPVGLALLCSAGNGGFIGGDFRYGISLEDADLNGLLISIGAGVAF